MNYSTYFDSAASTPLDPKVKEEILKHLDIFANNNSKHIQGFKSQKIIDQSLKIMAKVLGCNSSQLSICYSGTDANRRIIWEMRKKFKHENLFGSAVEHSSVGDEILEKNIFDPITFKNLPENPDFLALMGANSETGRIYDGKSLREKFPESFILRDYSQSFAKGILPDLENCDAGVFTPQKLYGPKNIGILYLKKPELFPEISKDTHTKNPWIIAAAAKSFEIWAEEKEKNIQKLSTWDEQIRNYIQENIPHIKFHDTEGEQTKGVINVAFKGIRGSELMAILSSQEEICISTGSACTTDLMAPTTVIKYIEKNPDWQYPIRISLHKFLKDQDVQEFCEILEHYVGLMRKN